MWQPAEPDLADKFVQEYGRSETLESTAWLELQQKFYSVERLAYYFNQQLVAIATFIRRPLAFGYCYYYSPRGPIFVDNVPGTDFWLAMFNDIKPWLAERKALFWRLEPASQPDGFDFKELGLRRGPDIQPSQSLVLDISCPEEVLLSQMHPKTRYNIRLAAKRGVVVKEAGEADFAEFWRLMKTTGQRDSFYLHDRRYYQAIVQSPICHLLLAKYQEHVIATGIFAYWGQTAVYLHGASDNQQRELMAPYLIQWQAIQLARQHGCQRYDLFGISQSKWPGVTRFKQGFGGSIVDYPGTFDWPVLSLGYKIYSKVRHWRRLLR